MSLKLNTNEFEVPIINKYPTLNLALIVLLFLIILIFVNSKLAEDIEKNRKIYEHKNLKQALEIDLAPDGIFVNSINLSREMTEQLGYDEEENIVSVYSDAKLISLIIPSKTKRAYNGKIELQVYVSPAGEVMKVLVDEHNETIGIVDEIIKKDSSWTSKFKGIMITKTNDESWEDYFSKQNFDVVTGASITSRSIQEGVYKALLFYKENKQRILSTKNES
ncbi:MAG: FMN-binding protein [Porticoccaceae bacterium]|nr:FMN-binding protein [Porticoccaceae bacterium]|tara:strand:- start:1520 stop:2182 length:663 start_codon:yes stop_codon:yes gene_type:complete